MGCVSSTKLKNQEEKVGFSENAEKQESNDLKSVVVNNKDVIKVSSLAFGLASNGNDTSNGVSDRKLPEVIADRYEIQGEALACGAFGCVYKAIDIKQKVRSTIYAVKVEDLECDYPQLEHEARMYKVLEGGEGIPRGYAYESHNNCALLVMDMLGESLQKLFVQCGNGFSVKTTLMLAEQMINRVQYLHEKDYVHRDLKPANFVIGYPGTAERNTIFILDFGMAKKWRNHLTGQIRTNVQRYYGPVGTPMFNSRMAYQGFEQARKDDLESLGYIFLYFLKSLPWANQDAGMDTEKIMEDIDDKKKNLALGNYNQAIPHEFIDYLQTCRSMKFTDDPDYESLKNMFRDCAKRLDIPYPYDYNFDWNDNLE